MNKLKEKFGFEFWQKFGKASWLLSRLCQQQVS